MPNFTAALLPRRNACGPHGGRCCIMAAKSCRGEGCCGSAAAAALPGFRNAILDEAELLHPLRGRAGEGVIALDVARLHEARQMPPQVPVEIVRVEGHPLVQHHAELDLLLTYRRGHADRRRLAYRWMRQRHALDLERGDVLAPPPDEIAQPTAKPEEAIGILHTDIASCVPAWIAEGVRGCRLVAEVTWRHQQRIERLDQEFTLLSWRQRLAIAIGDDRAEARRGFAHRAHTCPFGRRHHPE